MTFWPRLLDSLSCVAMWSPVILAFRVADPVPILVLALLIGTQKAWAFRGVGRTKKNQLS